MAIVRGVLGYLAAVFCASLIIWGWQLRIFTQPWPAQIGLVIQAGIMMPLAVVFSALPAFVLRMVAVIFHFFNPVVAGIGGAVTGAAAYLLLNTENMTGRPLMVDLHGLLLFSFAGTIAGLVWLWVERLGTNKE